MSEFHEYPRSHWHNDHSMGSHRIEGSELYHGSTTEYVDSRPEVSLQEETFAQYRNSKQANRDMTIMDDPYENTQGCGDSVSPATQQQMESSLHHESSDRHQGFLDAEKESADEYTNTPVLGNIIHGPVIPFFQNESTKAAKDHLAGWSPPNHDPCYVNPADSFQDDPEILELQSKLLKLNNEKKSFLSEIGVNANALEPEIIPNIMKQELLTKSTCRESPSHFSVNRDDMKIDTSNSMSTSNSDSACSSSSSFSEDASSDCNMEGIMSKMEEARRQLMMRLSEDNDVEANIEAQLDMASLIQKLVTAAHSSNDEVSNE